MKENDFCTSHWQLDCASFNHDKLSATDFTSEKSLNLFIFIRISARLLTQSSLALLHYILKNFSDVVDF